MDKQTFRVLEYERIMEMASCYAVTSPGASVVADISPLGDIAHIRERIDLVSEARRYLAGGQRPGIEHFGDLVLLFQKLRPRDAV
ncbi:hypothetical protein H8E50_14145, partial [bacterium]|nr:hypothetical protein [bacterium]